MDYTGIWAIELTALGNCDEQNNTWTTLSSVLASRMLSTAGKKITQQGRLITSWQPPSKALNIIQYSSKFSLITMLPYSLFKPFPLFSKLPMAPLLYHTLKWPSHLLTHIENSSHLKGAPSTHFLSTDSSSPGLHPCPSFYYNRMAICPHFSRSHPCLASRETSSSDSPFFLWYWQPITPTGISPPAVRLARAKLSHRRPTNKATEDSVHFQLFFLL